MKKTWLIIQREYLTRVRRRSFIVMSILGPLLLLGAALIPTLLMEMGTSQKIVRVVDESGLFKDKFHDSDKLKFEYSALGLTATQQNTDYSAIEGILYIPKFDSEKPAGFSFLSEKTPSFLLKKDIEKIISQEIENQKLLSSGIRQSFLDSLKVKIELNTVKLGAEGSQEESSAALASVVAYVGAFLIYFFIFLYGAQVMRGVIEEKTNRIVELIVSSVKPFELMMGKILGIAAVALTQFLIWIILTSAISGLLGQYLGTQAMSQRQEMNMLKNAPDVQVEEALAGKQIFEALRAVNIPLIGFCFVFYFLFGYLTYAALFGAIGAAVDAETDANQFMLPVTMPLFIAVVSSSLVLTDPNGTLAFWLSIIPFTSPVIMMIRLPFIGFSWELVLSMTLLVLGFVSAVAFAARIYRVGILMYGKKINYKEVSKWLFYKG